MDALQNCAPGLLYPLRMWMWVAEKQILPGKMANKITSKSCGHEPNEKFKCAHMYTFTPGCAHAQTFKNAQLNSQEGNEIIRGHSSRCGSRQGSKATATEGLGTVAVLGDPSLPQVTGVPEHQSVETQQESQAQAAPPQQA